MIRNSAIFDEIARLASGAAGSALEMKREMEAMIGAKIEQMAANLQLVTREEFEIVRQMASKAREENEKLSIELQILKERFKSLEEKINQK